MTAKAHSRGWEIYRKEDQWLYVDNDEPLREDRPCKRCGEKPTKEGYDACSGWQPGAFSVCCGHGVTEAFIE